MTVSLVDTTIRLLSQEPLAGRVQTARLLELASVIDEAGFACLEVSGGGCFDALVRRGVESPWERIRAIRARCRTPLGIALRGRFLVGSRPLERDLVRRFVASAAESGIDVFRIHDPLNDLESLWEAATAIAEVGKEINVGLVYSPGPAGESQHLLERAPLLRELGAARILVHDPSGSLDPGRARSLVESLAAASDLPIGVYGQGAGGSALAASIEAVRAGAQLVACALYPVAISLHRVAAEALTQALAGLDLAPGVDVATLWRASELVDGALGEQPVLPVSPRVAVRAAEHSLPVGLVAELNASLLASAAGDRLDEVLEELARVRLQCGSPPVAPPIGQILGSQALLHVLSAQPWGAIVDELRDLVEGRYGRPPAEVDPAVRRAVSLLGERPREPELDFESVRASSAGLAASEEELLLLALFGEEAESLLRGLRSRGRREPLERPPEERVERIRELIRIVEESEIGELTIEEGDMRVTVRRSQERPEADLSSLAPGAASVASELAGELADPPSLGDLIRIEAPMVGTFYRASAPGATPFVDIGDPVELGQTLCILEAMKLMNEVKAEREGVVRRICVENSEPVEYGQLLFELDPFNGRLLDGI